MPKPKKAHRQMPKGQCRERQAKTRNNLSLDLMKFYPATDNQGVAMNMYQRDGANLVLAGYAGTGKTYLAMYLALEELINGTKDRIVVIRSAVPTRNIGFLPGDTNEKMGAYEAAYGPMVRALFGRDDAYEILKQRKVLSFESTSFLRGTTYENCVIILDELQNCNSHELNTVMTRVGENCRVILCGDGLQSDLPKGHSAFDLLTLLCQNEHLQDHLKLVWFTVEDIVRSGFVKQWIQAYTDANSHHHRNPSHW